jgi:hypothetical protein
LLEPASRTIRGARDLISVATQYGNAFGQGMQAAALKPADFFGNDDVLYLMEDMATGEIRLSILWEWLHKGATLTEDDVETGAKSGEIFTQALFTRLLAEEYDKLQKAGNRDVHDNSKTTTLPIAREIVETYVLDEVSDGRKVGDDIIRRLLADMRNDAERTVGAEQEGVAVGRSAFHLDGGQSTIGAGLVDDDDRLADGLSQLLAGDTGERVAGRARTEGKHEPDGLGRIGLRVRHGTRKGDKNGKSSSN